MSSFEEDQIRASDIVRETSYHLWQSLLTVNGLYITLVVGISSFVQIDNGWFRFLLFVIMASLSVSSLLLVINFRITKDVFSIIANLSEKDIDKEHFHIKKAIKSHNDIKKNENIALGISAVITLLFLFFLMILVPVDLN